MRETPRPALRTILRDGGHTLEADCRPDALMAETGPGLADRLPALRMIAPTLLLRLARLGDDTAGWLDVALSWIDGIVLGACRDEADLVRLGTRIGVGEATLGRPDGTVFVLAEVGPAALLAPAALAAAGSRLNGLIWDGEALGGACGAPADAFAEAAPRTVVHTLLSLAGAAIGRPVFDAPSSDDALIRDAGAARRLGFAGKVAAHPGQVPALARLFAESQPM